MTQLTVSASPRALSRMLKNVIAMVTELRGEPATTMPYVLISAESLTDRTDAVLRATGRGLYTAGTDSVEAWSDVPGRAAVRVLAVNPDKTDEVDDLRKLATAIGSTSTARDARVFLVITDRHSVSVSYGETFLGELGEVDPEGQLDGDEATLGWFEEVHDALDGIVRAPETTRRLAYSVSLLSRLKDIKTENGCTVADFKVHPQHNTVGIALGETFRGLYEGIDRFGYATGGPWGDGPGNPDCLL